MWSIGDAFVRHSGTSYSGVSTHGTCGHLKSSRPVICYGLQGEGRAHAVRALSMARRLSDDYEVHLFSYDQGYDFLEKAGYPHLHRIEGMRFVVDRSGRVDVVASLWKAVKFLSTMTPALEALGTQLRDLNAVGVLTDFEPTLPRAGKRLGLPVVSIDTQHKFNHCTSPTWLPVWLRLHWLMAGCVVNFWVPPVDHTIISSFQHRTLSVHTPDTTVTNVFFRDSFRGHEPKDDGFVLVYGKQKMAGELVRALRHLKCPVKAYGFSTPKEAPFQACPISSEGFIYDLSRCRAVIVNAGNQAPGEARYFGKRVLMIPELGQQEQDINGWAAWYEGGGEVCSLKMLTPKVVDSFLERAKQAPKRHMLNGLDTAVDVVRRHIH